jgi:hypothetical protein
MWEASMTEAEWLNCEDPLAMLKFVRAVATDRKLRLFMVDACRRCWHLLADKPYRHAVEVAEWFAERIADANDLVRMHAAVEPIAMYGDPDELGPLWLAGWFADRYGGALASADSPNAPAVLAFATSMADAQGAAELCVPWAAALGVPAEVQAVVLRDVVHAPYRAVHGRASWRGWNNGIVRRLAEVIYKERNFDLIPILADALEEAGCTDADILNHCRRPGEHVRGCWVVDLLLGKS